MWDQYHKEVIWEENKMKEHTLPADYLQRLGVSLKVGGTFTLKLRDGRRVVGTITKIEKNNVFFVIS